MNNGTVVIYLHRLVAPVVHMVDAAFRAGLVKIGVP